MASMSSLLPFSIFGCGTPGCDLLVWTSATLNATAQYSKQMARVLRVVNFNITFLLCPSAIPNTLDGRLEKVETLIYIDRFFERLEASYGMAQLPSPLLAIQTRIAVR
jgi:hypothetical protein